MSTCPCRRAAARTRRRDVVRDLARSHRYSYLMFSLYLAQDLMQASRDAEPDEQHRLRELARTIRAGVRFAQGGAE
ncbi:MAG TPA: hypothetical protein PLP50_17730 [Thermoanaerobaculia bacterium]|nr:hypothetical protein [Thermoanaerobaculia bacterium]HQN10331.1 hypothetical protein [Thermoanaerobaculia bacterium]